jgi:hypothetical protein
MPRATGFGYRPSKKAYKAPLESDDGLTPGERYREKRRLASVHLNECIELGLKTKPFIKQLMREDV